GFDHGTKLLPWPRLRSQQSPDEHFGERARGSGVLPCEQVAVHDRIGLPGRTPRILGRQLLQLVLQQPLGSVGETHAGLLLVAETRHLVVREGCAAVSITGREETSRGMADDAEWLAGSECLSQQ